MKTIVGYKEKIIISINDNKFELDALLDTGNGGSYMTLGVDELLWHKEVIEITINKKVLKLKNLGEMKSLVGLKIDHRPIIKLDYIIIHGQQINNIYCAISDKRNNKCPILVNRKLLNQLKFIVDPSIEYSK